ncbi:MAG: MgtC/SapB family protein [Ferruginibacter sp.]
MYLPSDIIVKLLLSVIIGGVIGAEREYRSKSAGFRTLTMICMGATIFTILSQLIGIHSAPERIASNVVVGIGFVGAGVIFKSSGTNRVNGITTAAIIWVTAALGMGIGAGYELFSIVSCVLIMLVLFLFSRWEVLIENANQIRDYKIICKFEDETMKRFEELFTLHHLKYKNGRQTKYDNEITGEWLVRGSEKNHHNFISAIIKDPTVKGFEF